jgi:hypothetical protein
MDKGISYFDEEEQLAVGVFNGFLHKDDFKNIAEGVNNLRIRHQAFMQLYLCENMMVLSDDIMKWLNENWFPEALSTGLKCMAFVVPQDLYGRLSMERAYSSLWKSKELRIQYFNTEIDARQWLRNCAANK